MTASWMSPELAATAVPPSAIAPVIAFLLGPDSTFVTGTVLLVDG